MKTGLLVAALTALNVVAAIAEKPGRVEKPLVIVSNPPPVQMLVPGFTVCELPLNLNNINNLVYAPDGRLFALCYDGNVLQLIDADGDGLEDSVVHFFKNDHNEIPPSIGMCWGPGGLYITMHGRVIRLTDQGNGTGKLETVAKGWVEPTGKAGSDLEALGIVVAKDGTIYFGLGCDQWFEAYRINKQTGKSDYNILSDRGTIQRISPDWKKREAIATGLRFTVSLALNAQGDLFATDQEGATWLPNGNPFDELLHIQNGRHYGFPPRHPKHLPDVIDEPSTFDYGPQHQSACGLHFNEPVGGGKGIFGPTWWRGDALVAGESRGKIWRTKLVKTAAGYVARNDLIACLKMLTMDAVPTPQGDLLVTCHSGSPDWGTGPQGKGKLYKISYTDKSAPQPVLAYAATPTETRIIFDRAIEAKVFQNLGGQTSITMGRYVTAGERFESFRPGYQVVKFQRTMPRYELPVGAAKIAPDNRSLILQTAARTEAVNYAVTLPRIVAADVRRRTEQNPPPHVGGYDDIDVLTDLTGVDAAWHDANGGRSWTGWLPHIDLAAAQGLTIGSDEHAEFFNSVKKRGTLVLNAKLDLWQMLRAATQPDSKLDYEYPLETVTVVFKAKAKLDVKVGGLAVPVNDNEARVTLQPKENRWLPLEVTLTTGAGEPSLDVSWFTAEDARPRPLPLRRILLPWAKPHVPVAASMRITEIEGGDWQRGKKLFLGEPAICFKCHQVNGEGGTIGPNLSNLIYRDYASVMKDITEPSAAINPDHIAYTVQLKDGGIENGVVLENVGDKVVLGQASGQNLTIRRTNFASMKASAVSLMPEGLLKTLSPQQQKDLLTFLLTTPEKTGSK